MVSADEKELRSQISRIKETFARMFERDETLAEKIRTLFREQGVTVVSILAAVALAISTIASSIVAAVRGPTPAPTPTPPPPSKGGITDWIKQRLKNFAEALKKLGISAAGALPGIIGSILSWILNLLSKTVGWLAENLWALFLVVGLWLLDYLKLKV